MLPPSSANLMAIALPIPFPGPTSHKQGRVSSNDPVLAPQSYYHASVTVICSSCCRHHQMHLIRPMLPLAAVSAVLMPNQVCDSSAMLASPVIIAHLPFKRPSRTPAQMYIVRKLEMENVQNIRLGASCCGKLKPL